MFPNKAPSSSTSPVIFTHSSIFGGSPTTCSSAPITPTDDSETAAGNPDEQVNDTHIFTDNDLAMEIDDIIARYDQDKNGYIEYTEFRVNIKAAPTQQPSSS